jgi:S1-C subfamily serine protease
VEETATVRMSMNSGIFGRITADQVQVDGFTITGSSGSPIFNAAGEVVAVQRAGLQDAEGLSSAIPVSLVGPLLPRDARRALGLPPR